MVQKSPVSFEPPLIVIGHDEFELRPEVSACEEQRDDDFTVSDIAGRWIISVLRN